MNSEENYRENFQQNVSRVPQYNQRIKNEEKENQPVRGDVVETKGRTRFKKEDQEKKKIISIQKTTEDFLKEEIVRSIIDEVLSKIFNCNELSGESSSHYLHMAASQQVGPSGTKLWTVPSVLMGSHISLTSKGTKRTKEKKRSMDLVVRDAKFPISLPKNKHSLDTRPKFQRLIDNLVTTSSTIISPISESASCKNTLPDDCVTDKNPSSPFKLSWCFGYNAEVPIINLTNNESSKILFANSQHAVIYDFHEETMSFLEGHVNTVSCMTSDTSGSLLVTADSSVDIGTSRVIVWDQRSCVLQVLDNVHRYGCQLLGLSAKGEFLVTISANEIPISIKIWEWERNYKEASATAVIKESLGNVKKLTIHPSSKDEFAVTCERSVIYFRLTRQIILHESDENRVIESIKSCDFVTSMKLPPKLGYLTDTTFLCHSEDFALSSTSNGYVIMWNDSVNAKNQKTIKKYVRLHLVSITCIQLVDDKIAVATESGTVGFYDLDLKILFFHKLHNEPLVSLSFNRIPKQHYLAKCPEHPSCANTWMRDTKTLLDATLKNEPFSVRHYVVSTESGRIAYVNASSGTPKYLSIIGKEEFTAIDIMPNSKYLCAGTASGKCILIDTYSRKVQVSRQLKVQANMCQAIALLKYSPSGEILLCAMYTGAIWVLDPLLLSPVLDSPLTDCNYCITHMVFSSTSDYLVVADVSFCVSAYLLGEKPILLGQYIAHYKSILEVLLGPHDPDDKFISVFTLSSDRNVCEFKINKAHSTFVFVRSQRVEQSSIPVHSIQYPSLYTSVCSYIGVNNECKFRFHDPLHISPANVTRRTRGTIQAPDFGSPINFMETFYVNSQPYLFFKTRHHIGIHLFPIDGNPFRVLGYRISPTDIIGSKIDCNGKYVFTISGSDSGISMWKINTQAVEDFCKSGGEGLEPFLRMLGKEKEEEIRTFFDLGQCNHQGKSPNLVHTLKNTLPICEVPYVLQALGCLLTKQDIHELTHEMVNVDIENPTYNFEYDEFVRLYLNRRNSKYLNLDALREAFLNLVADLLSEPRNLMTDFTPVVDSSLFMEKLLITGEEMSADELYADLSILTQGSSSPARECHTTLNQGSTHERHTTLNQGSTHERHTTLNQSSTHERHTTLNQGSTHERHTTLNQSSTHERYTTLNQGSTHERQTTLNQSSTHERHTTLNQGSTHERHTTLNHSSTHERHTTLNQGSTREYHTAFRVPPSMPKGICFKTFVKDILGLTVEETVFRDF